MSKSTTTQTIDPDWLGKRDVEFLSELVHEWLEENYGNTESFSFSIEVTWEENTDE